MKAFFCALTLAGAAIAGPANAATPTTGADGIVTLASTHDVEATVARLKAALAAKGIPVFAEIDQARLGAGVGLAIGRSTLVLFGNPPLGVQFLQANRLAGLDWPVRMLVSEAADGTATIAWTDFAWIGRRYKLANRDAQLAMATEVAATIAAEAARPSP